MSERDNWEPEIPASVEISESNFYHKQHGNPSLVSVYENAEGNVCFYVCRWDLEDDKKLVLPLTFGCLNGTKGWHYKWMPSARPPYNLRELLARTEDQVLLVEGEKTANAASAILKEYVTVTTSGGSNSANSTDFSFFENREVTIWRDNDESGIRFSDDAINHLKSAKVKSLKVIQYPKDFPSKWDLADEIPQGYSAQDLLRMLNEAVDIETFDVSKEFKTTCLSQVQPKQIDFLWSPYIARGNLTILDGDPGLGKSHVTLAIATALSVGSKLPLQNEEVHGSTLLVACEDDLAQSVKPRLMRMRANCTKIHSYDQLFTLDEEGLKKLRQTGFRLKPDLIIIDPIFAYLGGGTDTNSANKVRSILAPLGKMASELNCAIVCVRHLNKNAGSQSLMHRGMGSIDFIAAARSGLTVVADPNDEGNRIIIHSKSNLAKRGSSIGFTFDGESFKWTGASSITEKDLLPCTFSNETRTSEKGRAINFLNEYLASGPKPANSVFEAAKVEHLSEPTIRRAQEVLGIISKKELGPKGAWIWSLPADKDDPDYKNRNDEYLDKDNHVSNQPDIDAFLEHLQDIQDNHDLDPSEYHNLRANPLEKGENI